MNVHLSLLVECFVPTKVIRVHTGCAYFPIKELGGWKHTSAFHKTDTRCSKTFDSIGVKEIGL